MKVRCSLGYVAPKEEGNCAVFSPGTVCFFGVAHGLASREKSGNSTASQMSTSHITEFRRSTMRTIRFHRRLQGGRAVVSNLSPTERAHSRQSPTSPVGCQPHQSPVLPPSLPLPLRLFLPSWTRLQESPVRLCSLTSRSGRRLPVGSRWSSSPTSSQSRLNHQPYESSALQDKALTLNLACVLG